MTERRRSITFFIFLFTMCIFLCFESPSAAFAFRTLEINRKAPEIRLKDIDGREYVLSEAKGKKIVLLFWGTDTEMKEKRSIALANLLERLYERFRSEGLECVSIISEAGYKSNAIALKKKFAWSHPLLIDEKREVYGNYGVYIVPTVGILDEEKRLVQALPYTHQMEEYVEGAVAVALGKKTKEEWEKERRPDEKTLPENRRKAQVHYNLGKNLLEKVSIERAREEFTKAFQLDPEYGEAYVGVAMTYLREKKAKEALPLLEKARGLDPGLVQAELGMALAWEQLEEYVKSITQLEGLLEKRNDTPEIHYHLGRLYEKTGQQERALSEYKKALHTFFRTE
jgi:tetratricopeptide (TPR) repeat protein